MSVYLAWSSRPFDRELVGKSPGPWREVRAVSEHVLLVDSQETLSQVYHHLKWSFGEVTTLLVTVCEDVKAKGLPPGTQTWVRARLSRDGP